MNAKAGILNNHFINSVNRGHEQFDLIAVLSDSELVKLHQSTAKPKSPYIAESIFNRMSPVYSFTDNMQRYIAESINIVFHNRKMENEIAYFRYTDGSTIHLSGKVAYHSAPCSKCLDPIKCKCLLTFDLRKREYSGVVGAKSSIVINPSLPVLELDL